MRHLNKNNKIHVFEISDLLNCPIDCPSCNQHVVTVEYGDTMSYAPCKHTIFIATDYEFIYITQEVKDNIKNVIQNAFDDDCEYNIDTITDNINLENSIKISTYDYPPSVFGFYIGFVLDNYASNKDLDAIVKNIEAKRDQYFDSLDS